LICNDLISGINQKALTIYKTEPCSGNNLPNFTGILYKPQGLRANFQLGLLEEELTPLLTSHFKDLENEIEYWKKNGSKNRDLFFASRII
jgi:hypothetical protein